MKLKKKDFIVWEEYFDTGIEIVDQQHHGLIDLVNKLASTLGSDADLTHEESRRLLNYLKEYAKIHFSTEEGLMALNGVDARHIKQHREAHLGFIDQLADMSTELGARGNLSGHQFMEFLANWLVFHFLGEDQQIEYDLERAFMIGKRFRRLAVGPGLGSTFIVRLPTRKNSSRDGTDGRDATDDPGDGIAPG